MPLVSRGGALKGTGGIILPRTDVGFTNQLTMGVRWAYEWNKVYSTTYDVYSSTFPFQVVNNVRSTFTATITGPVFITWNVDIAGGYCPGTSGYDYALQAYDPTAAGQAAIQACVTDIAHTHPGMYWMIWNEPDSPEQQYSDAISPTLGARYFKVISDTILGADSTARLIIGNVSSNYPDHEDAYCTGNENFCRGVLWLTKFITDYQTLYGVSPYSAVSGYGIHAYSTSAAKSRTDVCPNSDNITVDDCLMENWVNYVVTGVNWVNNHDPNKELWLTETNWNPGLDPQSAETQIRRMNSICGAIPNYALNRYGWYGTLTLFPGQSELSLLSIPYSGQLSPAGLNFINACR